MSIVAACQCGKRFTVLDDLAGRQVKCSNCGHLIQVPHTPATAQRNSFEARTVKSPESLLPPQRPSD